MPINLDKFEEVAKTGATYITQTQDNKDLLYYGNKVGFRGKIVAHLKSQSKAGRDDNKKVMRSFIRALSDRYGATVANMATKTLQQDLKSGKALTARHIKKAVKTAEQYQQLIYAHNKMLANEFAGKANNPALYAKIERAILDAGMIEGVKDQKKVSRSDAKNISEFICMGASPADVRVLFNAGVSSDEVNSFIKNGFTMEETVEYISSDIKFEDVRQFVGKKVPVKLAKEYIRLKIPFSEKTKISEQFQLGKVPYKVDMKVLGSGQFNTVYEWKDGEGKEFVYKEEKPTYFKKQSSAEAMGINSTNYPQWGMRNIATYKVSKLLGLDLIPKTEFAVHKGKIGIVMEKAKGPDLKPESFEITDKNFSKIHSRISELKKDSKLLEDLKNANNFDSLYFDSRGRLMAKKARVNFNDPVLQKKMIQLQWLDAVTGQTDRHCGNTKVEVNQKGEVIGVKGIDNDQAFGQRAGSFKQLVENFTWNLGMPDTIDKELRDKLLDKNITQKVEEELTGLVSPKEIEATKKRIQAIQDYLKKSSRLKVVENDDDWKKIDVSTEDRFFENYVARDRNFSKKINNPYGNPNMTYMFQKAPAHEQRMKSL